MDASTITTDDIGHAVTLYRKFKKIASATIARISPIKAVFTYSHYSQIPFPNLKSLELKPKSPARPAKTLPMRFLPIQIIAPALRQSQNRSDLLKNLLPAQPKTPRFPKNPQPKQSPPPPAPSKAKQPALLSSRELKLKADQ